MLRFSSVYYRRFCCTLVLRPINRTLCTAKSFTNGISSAYVESMYEAWLKDPSSIHKVYSCVQSRQEHVLVLVSC